VKRRVGHKLLKSDVAEIARRLALFRANCPKVIARDFGVCHWTVTKINRELLSGKCKRVRSAELPRIDAGGAL
jgi:hypothetical protein